MKKIKYAPVYYWNMYAPHKVLARHVGRAVYKWADNKYKANSKEWNFWIGVKNFLMWRI